MLKKIAILTLVLSVSSVASAQLLAGSIIQGQNFLVGGQTASTGIGTVINLVHGDAFANSTQLVGIANNQSAPCGTNPCWDPCWSFGDCDTEAAQMQDADLLQTGTADGSCGIITVNAFMDAAGVQEQTISSATDPKVQLQEQGVAADQILARSSGSGMATAANVADLFQQQAGSNAAGNMVESSYIGADQVGFTAGAANSTVTMANTLIASTSQGQQVF